MESEMHARTRQEWDKLPLLLTRAVVMEWTGLSKRDLDDEVRKGRIRIYRGLKKRKFLKVDVAAIVGMSCGQIDPHWPQSGTMGTHSLDTASPTCLAGRT